MDQISNLIISLKNAGMAGKPSIVVPQSKLKNEIADLLSSKGFVGSVAKKGKKGRYLEIGILYKDGSPRISDVKRVSKPSRRMYEGFKDMYPFKQGLGMKVFSTSKGILADMDAKKEKIGGEVLFAIW